MCIIVEMVCSSSELSGSVEWHAIFSDVASESWHMKICLNHNVLVQIRVSSIAQMFLSWTTWNNWYHKCMLNCNKSTKTFSMEYWGKRESSFTKLNILSYKFFGSVNFCMQWKWISTRPKKCQVKMPSGMAEFFFNWPSRKKVQNLRFGSLNQLPVHWYARKGAEL